MRWEQLKHSTHHVNALRQKVWNYAIYKDVRSFMRKITATIVYPVEVEITVLPDDKSIDDIWEELIKEGDIKLKNAAPVIYECSEPLINKRQQEVKINSQEDYFMFILQKLQQAKETLHPVLSVLNLLKDKAHPEVVRMTYTNLNMAIEYLISSVSPKIDVIIEKTY
jgi:hypothetical protein